MSNTSFTPSEPRRDPLAELRAAVAAETRRKGLAGAVQVAILRMVEALMAVFLAWREGAFAGVAPAAAIVPRAAEAVVGTEVGDLRAATGAPVANRSLLADGCAAAVRWIVGFAGATGERDDDAWDDDAWDLEGAPARPVHVEGSATPATSGTADAVRAPARRCQELRGADRGTAPTGEPQGPSAYPPPDPPPQGGREGSGQAPMRHLMALARTRARRRRQSHAPLCGPDSRRQGGRFGIGGLIRGRTLRQFPWREPFVTVCF